jgi:hypothetical protein
MCYMIVVALPPAAQEKWLARLPSPLRRRPNRYPALPEAMSRWEPVTVVTAQCSCDLFHPPDEAKTRNLRRKYERQGWSAARIERTLASRPPDGFPGSLHPDLRQWLAEAAKEAGGAYLLVHWDSAALEIGEAIRLSVADFRSPDCRIEEERLYRISARP